MDATQRWISNNAIWIMVTLVALGGLLYQIKAQDAEIKDCTIRLTQMEKCAIKIDTMSGQIGEIKDDVKAIKSIVYKPAIARDNQFGNN